MVNLRLSRSRWMQHPIRPNKVKVIKRKALSKAQELQALVERAKQYQKDHPTPIDGEEIIQSEP